MGLWSRRRFFLTSLAGGAAAGVGNLFERPTLAAAASNGGSALTSAAQGKRPVIISSANGVNALGRGLDILKKSGDTLYAVGSAVTRVREDPNHGFLRYRGVS